MFFNSPKCFNYMIFKTDFALKKYTTELPIKSYIDHATFRTINNRLPVEKWRLDKLKKRKIL